jgi:outer membrane protein W
MKPAVALLCLCATASAEPNRFYFRAGLAHLDPNTKSRELVLSDVHGPASLAIMDGPVAGSGASIDPVTLPAVIIGYTLPVLHDRLSIETILGAPFTAHFRATGTLATMSIGPTALGEPTGVPALGSELGEAKAAPPLVTAVYRPIDLGPVRPYVGAGASVLVTYNAHATNPILTEVAQPRFHVDPAPGLVMQTGFDLQIWRRVTARVDLKYIAFMKAHATVEDIEVATPNIPLLASAKVGTATMDMTLNPLIVQIGLGIDFF